MNKVLNTLLSLIALLALGAVTVGVTQLGAAGLEPAALATATPVPTTVVMTDTVATPVPIPPRVAPSPLVIRGEKLGIESVTYTPAILTAWSIDPVTKTLLTGDSFLFSWTRATGPNGSTNLEFEPITSTVTVSNVAEPVPLCNQTFYSDTTQSGDPSVSCYLVSAVNSKLNVGEYQGTLYVSDATGSETQVPVTVLVGRSILVLVLAVLAGVLVTEFWLWWSRSGRFKLSWSQRRIVWLDWLSKDQEWTRYKGTDPSKKDFVEREVLRTIQTDLRSKLKSIGDWLEQGRTGKLAVTDLPSTPEAIRQFTDPLLDAGWRYLKSCEDWESASNEAYTLLTQVIDQALTQVNDGWNNLCQELDTFLSGQLAKDKSPGREYQALEDAWKSDPLPNDKTLKQTREVAYHIWQSLEQLQKPATQLPKPQERTVPAVAQSLTALSAYTDRFEQEVILRAETQVEAVEKLDESLSGKKETLAFLSAITDIDLKPVKAIAAVRYPLQFVEPDNGLDKAVKNLQGKLSALNQQIDGLTYARLHDDVVPAVMLASVQKALGDIEAKRVNPTTPLPAIWNEIDATYYEKEHFVRLGRQIERLQVKHDGPRLRQAYQYLLGGNVLAAEVEVERVRAEIAKTQEGQPGGIRQWLTSVVASKTRTRWIAAGLIVVTLFVGGVGGFLLGTLSSGDQISTMMQMLATTPNPAPTHQGQQSNLGSSFPPFQATSPGTLPSTSSATLDPVSSFIIIGGVILFVAILIVVIFVVMPAIGRQRRRRQDGTFAIRFKERYGSITAGFMVVIMTIGWAIVSLTIAVTTIIAAREVILKNSLSTWGNLLDIVVAFTWGAVAHRLLQSLKSNWQGVQSYVEGSETGKEEAKS